MSTALILIDIQNDYFEGGKCELFGPEKCVVNAKQALSLFRQKQLPVFHVQHISVDEGATFFLPGSYGAEIHEQVSPIADEKVIVKHFPDSFLNTELQQSLEELNISRVIVCGMMSHMCIDTTVRAAKSLGYDVLLLHDACTTKDLSWNGTTTPAATVHNVFMASLQGTFAELVDTNSLERAL